MAGETPAAPVPRTEQIALDRLLEPELAARETMSESGIRELMRSMTANGQLTPLIVIVRGEKFEIADGHRRYIAALELGWKALRCEVYDTDGLAVEAAKVAAMVDREEWNPAQEAVYYKQLVDKFQLDEAGLCALVRRSADYVGSRWKLLQGDQVIFEHLRDGTITLGVAQQLNRVKEEMYRRSFLDSAIRGGAGARVVRIWVEEYLGRQVTPTGELASPPAAGTEPPPAPASLVPAPTIRACVLCGGYKDPQNLTEVTIHNYEWESVLTMLRKAQARVEAGKGE